MRIRRGLLAALVLGMCAMAPTRVRAVTTEVEGAGYAGESYGGWSCGPTMKAKYAGGAGRIRVSENDGKYLNQGVTVEAAGGVQRERYEIADCDRCDRDENGNPYGDYTALPSRWMHAGYVRAGYSGQRLGLLLGGSLYEGWSRYDSLRPSLKFFPNAEFYAGDPGKVRAFGGIGTPLLTSLDRPGVYGGADVTTKFGDVQVRGGLYRAIPSGEDVVFRVDGIGYLPVVPDHLDLRVSVALQSTDSYLSPEGGLGLRATF